MNMNRAVPFGVRLARTLAFAMLASACTEGTAADRGYDAEMNVAGGTFFRGAFPADGTGPSVLALYLTRTAFAAGYVGKSFSGVMGEGAVAAAVALEGDIGYSTVDAQPPGPEDPNAPLFDAPLSFAETVSPGEHRLLVWALDKRGRAGEVATTTLTLLASEEPAGDLVFRLTWDTEADLDLSVSTPAGVVISAVNPSSAVTTPGKTTDLTDVGVLDQDSNKNCVIDGIREENVAFSQGRAPGHYLAYLTATSLCDESEAHYRIEAYVQGERLASVTGTVTMAEMRALAVQYGRTLALDVVMP